MLQFLIDQDIRLFLFLNGIHTPFWDTIMAFVSGKKEWLPFYLLLIGFMIYKYRMKSIWIILTIIVLISLSDQTSVKLFKNVFERLRPCHNPDIQGLVHTINGRCGGQFGFVSSHAANSFALATFTSLFFRNRWFTYFIFYWAAVISYSRIYLGVHYPADVICGAFLGIILAVGIFKLYTILPPSVRY